MALWLCRSGRHCEHEKKFLHDEQIYLTWDGLSRDLGKVPDRHALGDLLSGIYPNQAKMHRVHHTGQIWAFAHRMQPGDWVASPSKRKTIHVGEIAGPYEFDERADDPYFHSRRIKWLALDIPRTNFDQDILYSLGAFTTICGIKRNNAEARVRAMQENGWKSTGLKPKAIAPIRPKGEDVDDDVDDATDETTIATLDLEQIGRDHIARTIYSKFKGHGLEGLVEAILIAQGFTTHRSNEGSDGGIDILAAPDTLGFGRPRICVQVKSQQGALERPVFDQLVGTMQHVGADQGLLVCWGGFKPTIHKVASQNFFKVRLWDQNALIDQFLSTYDKLDEDLQAEIPLKRIWAIADLEEGDQAED